MCDSAGAMDFGTRLAKELELRGMSQTEFARELGVSKQAANQWVNHVTTPGRDTLIRIEDLLAMNRGELLAMLGYRNPDDEPRGFVTPEEAIRRDPEIAAEDKRTLLRFIAGLRRTRERFRPSTEPARDDVALADEDERAIWALDLPAETRRRLIDDIRRGRERRVS